MIKIRVAEVKDCSKILDLLRKTKELQGSGNEVDSEYTEDYVLDSITDKDRNCVLVAEDGGIVGVLTAEISKKKHYSHFVDLAVVSSKRKEGIGSELYNFYESFLKKNKISTIAGIVRIDNKVMHSFCEKHGMNLGEKMFYFEKKIK